MRNRLFSGRLNIRVAIPEATVPEGPPVIPAESGIQSSLQEPDHGLIRGDDADRSDTLLWGQTLRVFASWWFMFLPVGLNAHPDCIGRRRLSLEIPFCRQVRRKESKVVTNLFKEESWPTGPGEGFDARDSSCEATAVPYPPDATERRTAVGVRARRRGRSVEWGLAATMVLWSLTVGVGGASGPNRISDQEVAKAIVSPENKPLLEAFLKYELSEVNECAAKPLLKSRPSLQFFIKQAERGPLDSLLFLEAQVHKLQDVQKNIDSLLYSVAFSASEKKKILGLRDTADKIVGYGIPLMKRDFYRVVTAARKAAKIRAKPPLELIPDPRFRDEVYRNISPTAKGLDADMGELSEGERICLGLGWVLEQVTVTKLWLLVNDNKLPKEEEYTVFRKRRSEYFQERLKRIYGQERAAKQISR